MLRQPFHRFIYVTTHSPTLPLLHLRHCSFSSPSFASPTSQAQLILQAFRHFTYVTTHSPIPSVALPTSQLILQPFRCFTYVTAHSPTLLSLLILQPFRHFTYVTTHFPTLRLLYLRHSSFSNPSVASPTSQFIVKPFFRFSFSNLSVTSPTSQLILQLFRRFPYVTAHSPNLLLLHLRHSSLSNPSFASHTSQALHLIHLASRPFWNVQNSNCIEVVLWLYIQLRTQRKEWWSLLYWQRASLTTEAIADLRQMNIVFNVYDDDDDDEIIHWDECGPNFLTFVL